MFSRRRDNKEDWSTLRRTVLARDYWQCQQCGARDHLEIHHQRFRSHGGGDEERNLITLCTRCHRQRHGQSVSQELPAED
jgi:5-methylcytosine-specific restriction endonuclease McrA